MNAGRSPEELKEFEDAAKRVALARPTASYIESMKTLLETTSAFGSTEHAIEHLDFMMKTASVIKASSGGKVSESAGEMGQQFAKFFEMRGVAGDAKRFEHEGNEMTRAMAFSGGTFNPREMYNFASQAKTALRGYDLDYISRVMPSLVGEQGGDKAGTGANAFLNTVMGKARDKKQAQEWMKYGLLDKSKVEMKNGQATSWSAGAVKDTELAKQNPMKWFEQTVLPAMRAKGVNVDDQSALGNALATMFRNQNANQFANENAQLADRTRVAKDRGLIDKTSSPDEMYKRNLAEDPTQSITAMSASLNSLASAVTQPAMKTAAGVITGIAEAMTYLAAAAKDHPITAMVAGGATAAGAAAGAGYMSYQVMNGFGLGASATALDGAAVALTEAAAALSAKGTASAAENAAEKYIAGGTGVAGAAEGAAVGAGVTTAVAAGVVGAGVLGAGALAYGHHGEKAAPYNGDAEMFPQGDDSYAAHPMTSGGQSLVGPYGSLGGIKKSDFQTDFTGLDEGKQKAEETKKALDDIGEAKVAPVVDGASLDAFIAKIKTAKSELSSLASGVGGAAAMNNGRSAPGTGPAGRTPSGR